ncbi:MAG: hypothetical protein ACP5LR_08310, partial [Athalassotoga sp.]|uniref:hypothetical protein n=1 Tax=Athalassotoga sp. TaxID=2022597 RepID=UPI003D050686
LFIEHLKQISKEKGIKIEIIYTEPTLNSESSLRQVPPLDVWSSQAEEAISEASCPSLKLNKHSTFKVI